ncbi:hypothetical protein [Clavibacter michiganensis]|uniref:hypothetical protein n=1 Tax=Clavibacter michiganensis TaxID=28447 RepID=UPI000A6EDE84|nr:hypothetical protein [Clavibacter michiganensis]
MKSVRISIFAAGIAVASLFVVGLPEQAQAAASASDNVVTFSEFISDFGVSPETASALEAKFAELPNDVQDAYLADPNSLFTFGPVVVATSTPSPTPHFSTMAAVRTRQVVDKQAVRVFGVEVGNFTLSYTFEATAGAVKRNLECVGSFSGFGLAGSTSSSDYVSNGRGTCSARHTMSYAFKGAPFSFTKLHTVSTVAGDPTRVTGSIRNV